jgi:CRISPR-associated protein Cas5d
MSISVEVWGEYALFSRPELKTERVSYDVMTPSAARGLLDAVLWHPGMKWIVDSIHVCAPIRFTNIRRNEVKDTVSARKAQSVMEKGGELYLATPESIQQRAAMVLRDVHYVIDAHFEMTQRASPTDNPGKFQEMMRRRVEKGQFYHQPCFGVREFPAHFKPCTQLPPCPEELKGEKDLGWMLLDMDYSDPENITPHFFRATLRDGVLEVPPMYAEEVRT